MPEVVGRDRAAERYRKGKAMDAVEYFNRRAKLFSDGYDNRPSFRERFALWTQLIDIYCRTSDNVLDVGCGPGIFTVPAARRGRSVLAVDGSTSMLALTQVRCAADNLANVNTRQVRLDEIATAMEEKFGFIICSSVLDYSDNLERDLDNLVSLLTQGGRMLVSLPNAWCPFRHVERLTFKLFGWPKNIAHIKNVKSTGFLRRELRRRGMKILDTRYYGSLFKLSFRANVIPPKALFNTLFVIVCEKV
jgi:2-polyprenyl-3-methyl-5-hydroxy-6-metoxy-1,4-benzoquinol methylase